jgi:hypothetical protein
MIGEWYPWILGRTAQAGEDEPGDHRGNRLAARWFGACLKGAILSFSFLSLTEAQPPEGHVP